MPPRATPSRGSRPITTTKRRSGTNSPVSTRRTSSQPPVFAIADEDLERDNGGKTSAVHFLRSNFRSRRSVPCMQGTRARAETITLP